MNMKYLLNNTFKIYRFSLAHSYWLVIKIHFKHLFHSYFIPYRQWKSWNIIFQFKLRHTWIKITCNCFANVNVIKRTLTYAIKRDVNALWVYKRWRILLLIGLYYLLEDKSYDNWSFEPLRPLFDWRFFVCPFFFSLVYFGT